MKIAAMHSLKKWLLKPKRSDQSLLAKFYYADEELNAVASELDSFDGRKDTTRCNSLVMKLRNRQDSVLMIIEQIMREVIPNSRARRDYRIKFPEEVLQESLAGQLWFGAECLAAGSSIVNKEIESLTMRPLAKSFTKQLDELRSLLRDQCFKNLFSYTPQIKEALVNFDQLFADFELSYVSAMVPVKSTKDYDALQDVTVLFCETVTRAMKLGLLNQDQFDSYDPLLMFTIPRLAIVCGLLIYPEGPLNPDQDPCQVSEMFRQQLTLLFKIRELLSTLDQEELNSLEKLICNPSGNLLTDDPLSNGGKHPQNSDEDDDDDDDEGTEQIIHAEGSALVARRFRENCCHSWPRDEINVSNVSIRESTHEDRPTQLRRGTSLVQSSTTQGGTRSVTWRGSSEFNFCLPRITGRDLTWLMENIQEVPHLDDSTETSDGREVLRIKGRKPSTCYDVSQDSNLSTPRQQHFTEQQHSTRQQHFTDRTEPLPPRNTLPLDSTDKGNATTFDLDDTVSTNINQSHELQAMVEVFNPNHQHHHDSESPRHNHKSSDSSSSCDSMVYLEIEHNTISRIIQMANDSAGMEARSKFKDSSDLLHQLFVCISKVADQLQTNFASDFRNILKATFECQSSPSNRSTMKEGHRAPPLEIAQHRHSDTNNDLDLTALDALEELVNTAPTACQEPYLAPVWLPDESSSNCMSCKVHFTFVRRRHHCRNCGKIFCSQCSSNYVSLPHIGHSKPVRACNACFIFHIIPFTNTSSSSS